MLLVKTPPAKIRSFSVLLGKEIGLEKKPFKGKCTLWYSLYIEIILQGLSGRSCNLEEDRGCGFLLWELGFVTWYCLLHLNGEKRIVLQLSGQMEIV